MGGFMTESRPTVCRGVRGATTARADNRDEILTATRQMLALMIRRNGIEASDVASVTFTVTKDLGARIGRSTIGVD